MELDIVLKPGKLLNYGLCQVEPGKCPSLSIRSLQIQDRSMLFALSFKMSKP